MDGPGGHCAKLHKSDKDTNCDLILICGIPKKLNSGKQRVDWWWPGLGQGLGEVGEGGQKLRTYKVNMFWDLMDNMASRVRT